MFRYLLFLCSALTATADKSASKERWRLIMVAVVTILFVAVVAFLGFRYISCLKKENEKLKLDLNSANKELERKNNEVNLPLKQGESFQDLVKQFLQSDAQNKEQMIRAQLKKISWLPENDYDISDVNNIYSFNELIFFSCLQFAEDEEKNKFMSQFSDLSKYEENYYSGNNVAIINVLVFNGSLYLFAKENNDEHDFSLYFSYKKTVENVEKNFQCCLYFDLKKLI